MSEKVKAWIEKTLLDQDRFLFEQAGPKHNIFMVHRRGPLASILIDPPPPLAIPWRALGSMSHTESFFERLKPVVMRHECFWFFVTMPENEYIHLNWVARMEKPTWAADRLYAFQTIGSRAGVQTLGLIIGEQRGVLVFSLWEGLEISFYGPELLWHEISSALYSD